MLDLITICTNPCFRIAEADRSRFVAQMEVVLDVYHARYDKRNVLIRMDEEGVRSLLLFDNPLEGWRRIGCRTSRTRTDWAEEVRRLLEDDYPQAETVTLVCDNLNTHARASLYHRFDATIAGNLRRRLRLVQTPKNGSWLNMAEMELSILSRQCLRERRFGTAVALDAAVSKWVVDRNTRRCGTTWRFTTDDARIKLQSLYPEHDI